MKRFNCFLEELKQGTILLWLDDIRDPELHKWQEWIKDNCPLNKPDRIHWVQNYNEFVKWINHYGCPTCISFDHDLGEDKTGYDCVKYLVNYCINKHIDFPAYSIQSDNLPGKKNMESYIENFKKINDK